jgi:hypothetical protein
MSRELANKPIDRPPLQVSSRTTRYIQRTHPRFPLEHPKNDCLPGMSSSRLLLRSSDSEIQARHMGTWHLHRPLDFFLETSRIRSKHDFLIRTMPHATRLIKNRRYTIDGQKERSYWGSNPGSRYSEIDMTRCLFQKPMCSPLHYTTVYVDMGVLKYYIARTKGQELGFEYLQRTWDSQLDRC